MIKPKFLSSLRTPNEAVSVNYIETAHFTNPLHYHKELELAYIIEGYGTRYVGSSIKSYKKGDLVLVGEELTHVWISHDDFYQENTKQLTKAIVVKFNTDFAGKDLLNLRESHGLRKVFYDALGGVRVKGEENRVIAIILHEMLHQSSFNQILSLLRILSIMSESKNAYILSPFDHHKSSDPKEKDRMNKIIQFTMLHFRRKIRLEEIAEVANLSKSAFCRYFKNTVKKSYNDFLFEVRVQYACKILLEEKLSMIQVCYDSGFNNPSAFSQIFKRIKGISPSQYRKQNRITRV
ncbi:AraC family transcriptional regulator [Zobellia galactanivorans]|nr:AraC family transcriptional regulator [Zobellia galactanivorans]MBU3028412.1 AraC family transcriptional regulator [Zobellia galactanivorans]MDO6809948.1 AraC family transcriptional regulator [Zobellia galactanivorans]